MRASREPRRFPARGRTAGLAAVAGSLWLTLAGTPAVLGPAPGWAAEAAPKAKPEAAPAKPSPEAKPAVKPAADAKAAATTSPAPDARTATAANAKATTAKTADAKTEDAKTATAKTADAKTVATVAKPAAAGAKATAKSAAAAPRVLQVPASRATGGAAAGATTEAAAQDEHVTYQYNALGRRDPFYPLLGGGFVGADEGASAPPDIGAIKVVGIVWGADDKFALVEDGRGTSMVLREGDKVMNGTVESLKRDRMIVKLDIDGQTQSVAIPLTRKGDQANETN
jgi:hypothetical protein